MIKFVKPNAQILKDDYMITQMASRFLFDYMWDDITLTNTIVDIDYYIEKLNLNCIEDEVEIFELLENYTLLNFKNFIKGDTINFKKLNGELMKHFGIIVPVGYINYFVESFEEFLSKND